MKQTKMQTYSLTKGWCQVLEEFGGIDGIIRVGCGCGLSLLFHSLLGQNFLLDVQRKCG